MTDTFESWINGMSDNEYEEMIDSGFTNPQKSKALEIRKLVDDEDQLTDLEREQESNVVEIRGEGQQGQQRESRQPVRVYDAREQPERPRYISTASGDSAVILPNEQKQTAQTRQAEIERQSIGSIQSSQEIQKRSIFNRIKNFILRRK